MFDAKGHGIVVSFLTVAETLALPARTSDEYMLERMQSAVLSLPGLVAVPFDDKIVVLTTIVRNKTGLKLPDAAVVAAALTKNACALIGNDRIWKNRDLGVPYHHLDDMLALE